MKTLYGLALLAAVQGGALVGYRLGAWSMDGARAELAELKRAASQAELVQQAMREKLEQELSTLKARHTLQVTQLGQAFQSEKLALRSSLATTPERLAAVETRRQQITDELTGTLKAREAAAGALQVELLKKEQEMRNLHAELEKERAGLTCLSIAAPNDEIRILNSIHFPEGRARP
ncbi:hypothetical protein [Corallococcus llansteffanensis]|uniref:hypothetical protein n=1 Tax=Corallococcus llansteffanensis TaxID=2316731 RepID=UPI0011C4878B|nr:hypothetical protein [Corallococcus llansteffanensis]